MRQGNQQAEKGRQVMRPVPGMAKTAPTESGAGPREGIGAGVKTCSAGSPRPESKRGRVRRLLVTPLHEAGFRRARGVTVEKQEAELASLCDHLAYLSDDGLRALRDLLLPKGQGKDHDIWPSKAMVIGHAEAIEPRPIEELEGLLRWFRSRAGPQARAEGTLVESYRYFQRYKVPPSRVGLMIRREAEANRDKLRLVEDRMAREVASPSELGWRRVYLAERDRVSRLVDEGEAARAATAQDEREQATAEQKESEA